jgi:branched-chain amino acid transport system substrate-binding protein
MQMKKTALLIATMLMFLSTFAFASGGAEQKTSPGVTDDQILVGYTMPMSGPLGYIGGQTAYGVEAVFKKYNDQGGIYGRKLKLITYDSGMDAAQALANYRKLILEDKVFCILFGFSNFVRPAYPFFEEQGVPWLFPMAPPEDMMFPPHKYLFSLFETTATQVQVMVKWTAEQGKYHRLAVIYGDSASGQTGLDAVKKAVQGTGVQLVAAEAIKNDAASAAVQVAKISQGSPDMVMIIGMTHAPAALAVKEIKKEGLKTDIMLGMPISGHIILQMLAGTDVEGLYGAWWGAIQWPDNPSGETPQMKAMRELLWKDYPNIWKPGDPESNVGGTVEHALSVELFVHALQLAGKDLTREGLIKALETLHNYDTGKGSVATFSPTRHEGVDGGYILQVRNGDWTYASKWIDLGLK